MVYNIYARLFHLLVFYTAFTLLIVEVNSDKKCLTQQIECEKNAKIQTNRVCGSDNRTYTSVCVLEMEKCKGVNVTLKHKGRCRKYQPCLKDLNNIQKTKKTKLSHSPVCLENGLYAPVQCHVQTGYCWCVTPVGKPIPNTARKNAKPKCTRRMKTRRRVVNKNERGICKRSHKQKFNINLMNVFRAEYGHSDDPDNSHLDQKILNWKFEALDRNEDDYLQKNEYRSLRKLKKLIKPKRCAKTFAKICDLDRDMKISREEWSACLGVDFVSLKESSVATLSGQLFGLDSVNRKDEQEANDCLSDRQAVLSEQRSSDLYVPDCTPDGRYRKMQCYKSTGYCWCVHEDDGKPIPGTSVKDQLPKCDSIPTPVRPMKGCPGDKRTVFLKDLNLFLTEKMLNNLSNESVKDEQEAVAKWSFTILDKNNNKYLERKEWKAFRALVANSNNLRRCGKRLPKYCDINNDRKISITEWLNCVDDKKSVQPTVVVPQVTTAGSISPKRKGPNPLEILLTHDDD